MTRLVDLYEVGGTPSLPLTMNQAGIALVDPDGYWYLGSPYSRHPEGLFVANFEVSLVSGDLIRRGVPVFSPIAHTHGVACAAGIDPFDYDVWIPADKPLMDAAFGLIVAMMDGWETSHGLAIEVEAFKAAGKPIVYVDPIVDGWLQAARTKVPPAVDGMAGHKRKAIAA